MRTLAASVFIAGLTVGIGWNGNGTWTWGIYALATVGAWCLLNLIGLGLWALLVDHWRESAARSAGRGSSSARGPVGRKPRLAANLSSPGDPSPGSVPTRQPGLDSTTKVSRPLGH